MVDSVQLVNSSVMIFTSPNGRLGAIRQPLVSSVEHSCFTGTQHCHLPTGMVRVKDDTPEMKSYALKGPQGQLNGGDFLPCKQASRVALKFPSCKIACKIWSGVSDLVFCTHFLVTSALGPYLPSNSSTGTPLDFQ